MGSVASEEMGLSENVSLCKKIYILKQIHFVCVSYPDATLPTLASLSVPVPQTANTTAGVQVEHTEVKKHYNTLNGYCDHKSTPPHTPFEEARVCVSAILHYSGKNFT